MTVVLDDRAHATAIKAAVTTALQAGGADWEAYDYGEVPGADGNEGTLPNMHAIVTVEQIPSSGARMSGQTGTTRWIASIRGVGRTVREAQWVLWKAKTALHEQRLTIDDVTTEPLQAQPGQAPELDDGRYAGLSIYTYSH